jgi:hypothetical protein
MVGQQAARYLHYGVRPEVDRTQNAYRSTDVLYYIYADYPDRHSLKVHEEICSRKNRKYDPTVSDETSL